MDPVTEPECRLTDADEMFLRRHAGVREATPDELVALAERTAARDAFELVHTLSLPAVAALLGVSERAVVGMTAGSRLLAHELAGDGRRWPDWQFAAGRPLPHLSAVVAAIPAGSHPTGVRTAMTTPDAVFLGVAEPLSPRDWLLSGGAPDQVVEFARVLGEQI